MKNAVQVTKVRVQQVNCFRWKTQSVMIAFVDSKRLKNTGKKTNMQQKEVSNSKTGQKLKCLCILKMFATCGQHAHFQNSVWQQVPVSPKFSLASENYY